MWLAGLRDRSQASDAQIAQALADAESGKPLTVSTFKEEMETVKAMQESVIAIHPPRHVAKADSQTEIGTEGNHRAGMTLTLCRRLGEQLGQAD